MWLLACSYEICPFIVILSPLKGSWSERVAFVGSSTISNSPGESRSNERYWRHPNKVIQTIYSLLVAKTTNTLSRFFWHVPDSVIIFDHSYTERVMIIFIFSSTQQLFSFYGFPYIFIFMISSYHGWNGKRYFHAACTHCLLKIFYLKNMLVPAAAHAPANYTKWNLTWHSKVFVDVYVYAKFSLWK